MNTPAMVSCWTLEYASVWTRDYKSPASEVVAAFDLEGTLVTPRTLERESICTADDWRWWDERVPARLRDLAAKGFKLVLFSNQAGSGKLEVEAMQALIDAVQASLQAPLLALVSTKNDVFRRPRRGMWTLFTSCLAAGCRSPKMEESFFVGDAAGRPKGRGMKKDAGDSDLKFALNVGLHFKTPEEFFLGDEERPAPSSFSFNPTKLQKGQDLPPGLRPANSEGIQELVVLIGPPCSGKSTLAKGFFADYVRINQDELKSKEKCVKTCREALRCGKRVVIDNQNRSRDTRCGYIGAAAGCGVPVRAVLFDTPKDLSFHLNCYRTLKGHESLPAVAIHQYWSKFEGPLASEGFSEIHRLTLSDFCAQGEPEDVALLQSFLE